MSAATINRHLHSVLLTSAPTSNTIGEILGCQFDRREDDRHLAFIEASAPPVPYTRAEIKLNQKAGTTELVLNVDVEAGVLESQLNPPPSSPPTIEVNAKVHPEGTVDLIYELGAIELAVSFTATTRRLRALVVTWSERGRPAAAPPPDLLDEFDL